MPQASCLHLSLCLSVNLVKPTSGDTNVVILPNCQSWIFFRWVKVDTARDVQKHQQWLETWSSSLKFESTYESSNYCNLTMKSQIPSENVLVGTHFEIKPIWIVPIQLWFRLALSSPVQSPKSSPTSRLASMREFSSTALIECSKPSSKTTWSHTAMWSMAFACNMLCNKLLTYRKTLMSQTLFQIVMAVLKGIS